MGRAGAEPHLKLLDLLMIPRQRTQGSNARRTERSTGRRVGLSPRPVPTQPATHTRAGTARVGIGIPRGTAEAVPSPRRGDSGALFPGTPREVQRPRGLARPSRYLHTLQSQRFKVRSAGRPSPAWPRRFSSPGRQEPLARPTQRVNGRRLRRFVSQLGQLGPRGTCQLGRRRPRASAPRPC